MSAISNAVATCSTYVKDLVPNLQMVRGVHQVSVLADLLLFLDKLCNVRYSGLVQRLQRRRERLCDIRCSDVRLEPGGSVVPVSVGADGAAPHSARLQPELPGRDLTCQPHLERLARFPVHHDLAPI